ncbi:MAG: PilZ domain-containing protein [Treponema sp.]|nr:PilZ domain-containing protein [Treponema sp.]
MIVYRLVSGTSGGKGKGKKAGGSSAPRKYNVFSLMRVSSSYGLDREQSKMLEYVFRTDGVSDIDRSIKNPVLLDRHFKRAFRAIEKSGYNEEEVQQRLVKLFALRNALDAAPDVGGSAADQLKPNTPVIIASGNNNYSVKLILAKDRSVVTEIPKNTLGSHIRFQKGARVTVSFPNNGFSIEGQVIGTGTTVQGPGLQISHSGRAKALVKRKHRRKQTDIDCVFYLVNVQETGQGRKKESKLVVDSRKFTGSLQDMSVGGCAMTTKVSIQAGTRLKIAIDYDHNLIINVLGQVLRVNRSGSAGTIMHIKFLKVPRRAFNSISTLVFGFNE